MDIVIIMQKLDEKALETIASDIVTFIFEDAAMMSMGGTSSSGQAMATPPPSAGGTNGQGDLGTNSGSVASEVSPDDNKKTHAAKLLNKVALSKASISSLKGATARGAHTGIVKTGDSFSLKTIVKAINSPFAGSRLQTDGEGSLKGSKISVRQLD